jgi:release factor glutamine methyltransferase
VNIQQALQQATQTLNESSSSALLDAQVLLTHVLQCNTAHLAAWPEKDLNQQQQSNYLKLVQQRNEGMPVAHLTGHREFWSLNFDVNNSTLIPRPETETLVDYILTSFDNNKELTLLDMGTGTGAIAIAIAIERPRWEIIGSDISEQAIQLAQRNAEKNKTGNTTFFVSDWFENIPEKKNGQLFDIIVSNPPYIADDDPHLQQGDVRFEPLSALTSGITGMDDIEHLCAHARYYLKDNGCLIIEHGYNQQQLVAECFIRNGYTDITQKKDLSGHIRMTMGKTKQADM